MFGISGLILQTVCYAVFKSIEPKLHTGQAVPRDWVGYALIGGLVLGTILFILGLCDYAKAKGYSGFWGLLGFCSWPGLV